MGDRPEFKLPSESEARAAKIDAVDVGFWAWTLGDLLHAEVPILEAIQLCFDAFPNAKLRWMGFKFVASIREGGTMQDVLDNDADEEDGVLQVEAFDGIDECIGEGESNGGLWGELYGFASNVLDELALTLSETLRRSEGVTDLVGFLAASMAFGVPPVRALRMLASPLTESGDPFGAVVEKLAQSVEGGNSLSVAMEQVEGESNPFDPILIALVKAGEISGQLDLALAIAARQASTATL